MERFIIYEPVDISILGTISKPLIDGPATIELTDVDWMKAKQPEPLK